MPRRRKLAWIGAHDPLPSPHSALDEPNGLVAAGSDLSAARLLEAYTQGMFPWYSDGQPVLWWSPDPRMVMFVDEFSPALSLRKKMRQVLRPDRWSVTLDQAFEQVMRQCAAPRSRQNGTWISEEIIGAYVELHRAGFAHSVEVWEAGDLIGGLYGVAIGRMFYGESMFARRSDASKVAFSLLLKALQRLEFHMVDCQQDTAHLASLGARVIDRAQFLDRIASLVRLEPPDWRQVTLSLLPGDS